MNLPVHDRHYLHHVMELGESNIVFAREDIQNVQGLTLLAKGTPIGRQSLDRLIRHKLLKPIDLSIAISDTISAEQMAFRATRLLEEHDAFSVLYRQLTAMTKIPFAHLRGVPLNYLMTNKLTVMQKCLPRLLDHSLRVAILAVALGNLGRFSRQELDVLATAGVFHDVGELHIDPSLMHGTRPLSQAEWQQIQGHPLIGHAILRALPEYHPLISRVVLEHHERLDGSGYPQRVTGDAVEKLGRVLAVAELVTGIAEKSSLERLELVLKSERGKFDRTVVDTVISTLHMRRRKLGIHRSQAEPFIPTPRVCDAAAELLNAWMRLSPRPDFTRSRFGSILAVRMSEIQQLLLRAGNTTDFNEMRRLVGTDPEALEELTNIAYEVLYRIRQAINEARLHGGEVNQIDSPNHVGSVRTWLELADNVLAQI